MRESKRKLHGFLAIAAGIMMIISMMLVVSPAAGDDGPVIYRENTPHIVYTISDYGHQHSVYMHNCGVGTFRAYTGLLTEEHVGELNELARQFRIPERFRLKDNRLVIEKL